MTRRNPLAGPIHKLKDTAVSVLRHPAGAAGKVVGQAKGTAALGRTVAEGVASQVAGQVAMRTGRGRPQPVGSTGPGGPSIPTPVASPSPVARKTSSAKLQGDPVAPEATAKKAASGSAAKKTTAKKAVADKGSPPTKATARAQAPRAETPRTPEAADAGPIVVPGPEDEQAARAATPADVAKKAAKKAPAKKAPAKKAPAKKAAKKTAPAQQTVPGDSLPPRKEAGPKATPPADFDPATG